MSYDQDTEEMGEAGAKEMEATKEEAEEEVMDVTEGGVKETEIDVGQKRKVQHGVGGQGYHKLGDVIAC